MSRIWKPSKPTNATLRDASWPCGGDDRLTGWISMRAASFAGTRWPDGRLVLRQPRLLFGPGILHCQGNESGGRTIILRRNSCQLSVARPDRLIAFQLKHRVGAGGRSPGVRPEAGAAPRFRRA